MKIKVMLIIVGIFLFASVGNCFLSGFPSLYPQEERGKTAIVILDNFQVYAQDPKTGERQELTINGTPFPHGVYTYNNIRLALQSADEGYQAIDSQGKLVEQYKDGDTKVFLIGAQGEKSSSGVQLDLADLSKKLIQISLGLAKNGYKNIIWNLSFGGPPPQNETQRKFYQTLEQTIAYLSQYNQQNGTNITIVAPTARHKRDKSGKLITVENYPGAWAGKYPNIVGIGSERHGYIPGATTVLSSDELCESKIDLRQVKNQNYGQWLVQFLQQYLQIHPEKASTLSPIVSAPGNSFATAYTSGMIAGELAGYSPDKVKLILSSSTDEGGKFEPQKVDEVAKEIPRSMRTSPQLISEPLFDGFIW
jgi:hypothetical protein